MLLWKLSVFKILLDKELVNCLVEARMKLGELILAAMVFCVLIRVPCPFYLQRTSVKCGKVTWEYKVRGRSAL